MAFVLKWRSQEGKMHLNINSFKTGEGLWYKEHSLRVKYAILLAAASSGPVKKLGLHSPAQSYCPKNELQFCLVPSVVHSNGFKTYFKCIMVFTNIYFRRGIKSIQHSIVIFSVAKLLSIDGCQISIFFIILFGRIIKSIYLQSTRWWCFFVVFHLQHAIS